MQSPIKMIGLFYFYFGTLMTQIIMINHDDHDNLRS